MNSDRPNSKPEKSHLDPDVTTSLADNTRPKKLERVANRLMPRTAASVASNPKVPSGAPFSLKLRHFLYEKLTRKEFVIGGAVFAILFGSLIAYGLTNQATAPTLPPKPKPRPVPPVVITSPLTGLQVSLADSKRIVTGVMIENSDFARPQSGLREAGVVFEGIAEAGITRFLALYQEAKPINMGPIRSARPYFLEWDLGFDAPLAHVGGSPEALADIRNWHVKNLDEFFNAGAYHRITARFAPHNVYTSIAKLNQLEKSKGWTTSHFTGFLRKKDTPAETPTATTINFNISWSDFYVRYQYDAQNNAYLRWEGAAPHRDATTGKQLEPKVAIGLVMPYSLERDGYHSDYSTLGTGKAYIFQDGTVAIGTWSKPTKTSQFTFTDLSGNPIRLNAGQTWLTALASPNEIHYSAPTPPPAGTKP